MPRKPTASADVRARILAAACALLAHEGVTALTQPKVSRAAGVSQSHLTYYFPKRADLRLAVARQALEDTVAQIHAAASGSRAGRIARGVGALQSRLADQRIVRLMVGLIVASETDRALKRSLATFVDSIRAMLRGALQDMGLATDRRTVAAVHAMAVGLAVLNLARDTAASRREVGEVMGAALPRLARRAAPRAMKGAKGERKT
jgi:AcrR family transcriptional regulator